MKKKNEGGGGPEENGPVEGGGGFRGSREPSGWGGDTGAKCLPKHGQRGEAIKWEMNGGMQKGGSQVCEKAKTTLPIALEREDTHAKPKKKRKTKRG